MGNNSSAFCEGLKCYQNTIDTNDSDEYHSADIKSQKN